MLRNSCTTFMCMIASLLLMNLTQACGNTVPLNPDEMGKTTGSHVEGLCRPADCNTASSDCDVCGPECCRYREIPFWFHCYAETSGITCHEELSEERFFCCLEYWTGSKEGNGCPEGCPNEGECAVKRPVCWLGD